MKFYHPKLSALYLMVNSCFAFTTPPHSVHPFHPGTAPTRHAALLGGTRAALKDNRIMSDMDIMCIANTAELCSFYGECNLEEREAILNRLEEQTDTLAERMAMMQAIVYHIHNNDRDGHVQPKESEVEELKGDIIAFLKDADSKFGQDLKQVHL